MKCGFAGSFYIDINGTKGPNKMGRYVFEFRISDKGKLYPSTGKDEALYSNQTSLDNNFDYWIKNTAVCGTPGGKADESYGKGCAAIIMENNWVMDY